MDFDSLVNERQGLETWDLKERVRGREHSIGLYRMAWYVTKKAMRYTDKTKIATIQQEQNITNAAINKMHSI